MTRLLKVREDLIPKFEKRGINLHNGTLTEERAIKEALAKAESQGQGRSEQWAKEQIDKLIESGIYSVVENQTVQPTVTPQKVEIQEDATTEDTDNSNTES